MVFYNTMIFLHKQSQNIIKIMKSTLKQDYFIINSPQDDLKEISLGDTIQKVSFESPRLTKRQTEKFAIDSWDISQKLKPNNSQNQRYKETFSTNLSATLKKSRFRAKSALLTKDLQTTNDHNFSSKNKNTLQIKCERKSFLFFNKPFKSIDNAKASISLSKQSIKKSNKILNPKSTIQRRMKQQQQARAKTIQSYLTHQKQIINRQKQILFSQRIGKQGIQFCIYPTQYWQDLKKYSPVKRNRNRIKTKVNAKIQKVKQQKPTFSTITPPRKTQSIGRMQESQMLNFTQSKSPLKRFQYFKEKINQITIH